MAVAGSFVNGRVWFTFLEIFSEGILYTWHIKRSLFAKPFDRWMQIREPNLMGLISP